MNRFARAPAQPRADRRRAGMKGIHPMTDTGQHFATPAQASADYQKTIRVKASPEALFDALTSLAGLAAWWTRATGSGDTGGELRFLFDSPEQPCVMHVDQATRPTSVQWTCTEYSVLPDWAGTCPVFTITPAGGGASELRFRHHGLTPELDCIEVCTRGWDHFLASLRAYVETGRGMPFGSSEDYARRVQEAPRLPSDPEGK
jgi:uncharacterized protein YndB with AHSA1/START domain